MIMIDAGAYSPVARGRSSFVNLRIRFHEVVNLLHCPSEGPGQRRMYIRTTLEPGNIAAVTTVFTDSAQFPLETAMSIPPLLCFERASSSEILVELWRIQDEAQHELVGFRSATIESLIAASSTRLTLARRNGKVSMTSLTVSATTSPCSQFSALASVCANDDMGTGAVKSTVQSAFVLTFMVLVAVGLEEDMQPVVLAALQSEKETSSCWSDVGIVDEEIATKYIWNHQCQFTLTQPSIRDSVLELGIYSHGEDKEAMKTCVNVASLVEKDPPVCESWIPLARMNDTEAVAAEGPRVHIAWHWTLIETCKVDQLRVERTTHQENVAEGSDLIDSKQPKGPPSIPKLALPSLASTICIGVHSLCRLSSEAIKWINRFVAACKQGSQELLIRAQLDCGRDSPVSEYSVLGSSIRIVSDHCPGQVCAIFGDSFTTAQLPLKPELAVTLCADDYQSDHRIYQALIKIRPKASKLWSLSSSFAVSPVLREISPSSQQLGWRFALLDHEEVAAGEALTTVSYASLESHGSADCEISPWIHILQPRRAVCQLRELEPTSNYEADASASTQSLMLRIWTNTTGRRSACVIPALSWTRASDDATSASCVLPVYDISCEVFHVELYETHADHTRRLLGVGAFTTAYQVEPFPATGRLDDTVFEKHVALISTGERKKPVEIAKAVVQVALTATDDNSAATSESVTMASASSLRDVSYLVERCESQSSLSLHLEQLQLFQRATQHQIDAALVELRLSTQSRWSSAMQWATVTAKSARQAVVIFNEHFEAPMRWSAKDRCLPYLQIRVKVRRRQQQEPVSSQSALFKPGATTETKSAIRTPVKPHGSTVQLSGNGSEKGGAKIPITSAFEQFDLDLSAFFAQASGWTRLFIPIADTASSRFGASVEVEEQPAAALLLQVRVGTDRDQRSVRSADPGLLSPPLQSAVHGDVCVHLQQASGSFLQARDTETSSFIVTLTWMGKSTSTSQVNRGGDGKLTWNEHIALPVKCEAAPILQIRILKRTDNRLQAPEQLVASASFPVFHALSTKQHLMHFELPLSASPADNAPDTREKGVLVQEQRRVGMLSMDAQFIERSAAMALPNNSIELVVHELRGISRCGADPGAGALVKLEVYALKDSSVNKCQSIWTAKSFVVSLAHSSATTTVNEPVDLSSFEMPDDGSAVIAVGVSNISGDSIGCAHIPLHKNWRKRLLSPTSRSNWYKVFAPSNGICNHSNDAALLVSFQRVKEDVLAQPRPKEGGALYFEVIRAVSCHEFDDSGASVASFEISQDGVRRRTRRAAWSSANRGWQWEDEWISLHQVGVAPGARFQCELTIEGRTALSHLGGEFYIPDNIPADVALSLTEWVPLTATDQTSASQPAQAYLLMRVLHLPPVAGTIQLSIRRIQSLGCERTELQIENSFLTCTFQSKTSTSCLLENQVGNTEETSEGEHVSLRIPFSTDASAAPRTPFLILMWMGQSRTFGEVCLGSCAIELAACLPPQAPTNNDTSWSWCEFHERMDRSSVTALCQMKVAFQASHQSGLRRAIGSNVAPSSMHAVVRDNAETLAIWKKFFYLLDKGGNGVVDLGEFTNMFASHLDDMIATSDGKKLLALLFDSDDKPPNSNRQIRAFFAAMDADGDERIQWDEYLAFLRRRQLQKEVFHPTQPKALKSLSCGAQTRAPSSTPPQLDTAARKEQRRKNREDQRTSASWASETIANSSSSSHKRSASRVLLPMLGKSEVELNAQVAALTVTLELEKQKYAKLHDDWQALHRSYQQLHLKQQKDMIQEQVRAKRVSETLERQEAQLCAREAQRKQQHDASIVLQSTLRSRLEQKRYHGIKMHRTNAATTLQCWYRQRRCIDHLKQLKAEEKGRRMQWQAAIQLQEFVRYHHCRKERQLMVEARHLSARIIQKLVRGILARVAWTTHRRACILIQCWARRMLARVAAKRHRAADTAIRRYFYLWVCKRRYRVAKISVAQLQRWWRRVHAWRCEHLEQLEAAISIQAAWRGKLARMQPQHRRAQHQIFCAQVKAVTNIQVAWRRAQQRIRLRLSTEASVTYSVLTVRRQEVSGVIDDAQSSLETPEAGDLRVTDPMPAEPHDRLYPVPNQLRTDDGNTVIICDSAPARSAEKDEEDFIPDDHGDEALPPDESAPVELSMIPAVNSKPSSVGETSEQVSPPYLFIDEDVKQVVHEMTVLIEFNPLHPSKDTTGEGQRSNQSLSSDLFVDLAPPHQPHELTGEDDSCASFSNVRDNRTDAKAEEMNAHVDESENVAPQEPVSTTSPPTAHVQDHSNEPARDLSNAPGMGLPGELVTIQALQSVVMDLVEQMIEAAPRTRGGACVHTAHEGSDISKSTLDAREFERGQPSLQNTTLTKEGSIQEQHATEEHATEEGPRATQELSLSPILPEGEAESSANSLSSQLDGGDLAHRSDDTVSIDGSPSAVSTTSGPVESGTDIKGNTATMSCVAATGASNPVSLREAVQPPSNGDSDLTDRDDLLSESEDDRGPRVESSIDSSDLMWDADAIAAPQGAASADTSGKSRDPAPASRMNSERILSDLRRFEESS